MSKVLFDYLQWKREKVPGDPSARAREIVEKLLREHGVWVYRDPSTEEGFRACDYYCLTREEPPAEALVLVEELLSLPRAAAVAAAVVPPAAGDVVEAPKGEGVIVEAKIPDQASVRFADGRTVYYDPHPWVLRPVAPGRWRVGF